MPSPYVFTVKKNTDQQYGECWCIMRSYESKPAIVFAFEDTEYDAKLSASRFQSISDVSWLAGLSFKYKEIV